MFLRIEIKKPLFLTIRELQRSCHMKIINFINYITQILLLILYLYDYALVCPGVVINFEFKMFNFIIASTFFGIKYIN